MSVRKKAKHLIAVIIESKEMRRELYHVGVSQISAGSKTEPGAYSQGRNDSLSQFSLNDTRPTGEVVLELLQLGFVPSWCTACYRAKRTGESFMKITKKGGIHEFCLPNSLLTFAEYLYDYGDEQICIEGSKIIEKQLQTVVNAEKRAKLKRCLTLIKDGKRDLFF